MEKNQSVGKRAISKEGKVFGKIIRIDKLMGKTVKKKELFLIIQIKRFLKSNLSIPVTVKKITKITEKEVFIDLTFNEFIKEIKKIEKIELERKSYKEYPSGSWKDFQGGVRLPKRRGD